MKRLGRKRYDEKDEQENSLGPPKKTRFESKSVVPKIRAPELLKMNGAEKANSDVESESVSQFTVCIMGSSMNGTKVITTRQNQEKLSQLRRELQTLWKADITPKAMDRVIEIINELERLPNIRYVDAKKSELPAMLGLIQKRAFGDNQQGLKNRITDLRQRWQWKT